MVLKMNPKSKEEFDLNFQKTRELLDGELNLFMKSFWMTNISNVLRSNYLKSLWILFKLINNVKTSKWPLYVKRFNDLEKFFIESLNYCNLVINSVQSAPKKFEKPRILHPILKKGLNVLSESSY